MAQGSREQPILLDVDEEDEHQPILVEDEEKQDAASAQVERDWRTAMKDAFHVGRYYTPECTICMDRNGWATGITGSCGHTFHVTCMTEWQKQQTTCPICRKNFVEYKATICLVCKQVLDQPCISHKGEEMPCRVVHNANPNCKDSFHQCCLLWYILRQHNVPQCPVCEQPWLQ